jgi:hypothetical protein
MTPDVTFVPFSESGMLIVAGSVTLVFITT